MNFNQRLREKTENWAFCYGKEGGQGFINKELCKCHKEGVNNNSCQSYLDREKYISRYLNLEAQGLTWFEIMQKLRVEFRDNHWFQNNIDK